MSNHIHKNDPKRWVLVMSNQPGEEGIKAFGNLGPQGSIQLDTGQPQLYNYLNEPTLEAMVNTVAGVENYYKDAVESGSEKFLMPSGLYEHPLMN